jgi:dihydroorotate dehydrogenase electron transfer subunit
VSARTLAPFGRRRAPVLENRAVGAYRLIACADHDAPAPQPGQFYMLAAAERWGGGSDERPFLPRAFSFLRHDDGRLEFLLEAIGPGTRRLAELEPGDGLLLLGPLGVGFEQPRDDRRALLAGGGIGVVPLAGWQDRLAVGGRGCTVLLGFRDAEHAQAASLFDAPVLATDDGSVGRRALVTELLAAELDRGDPAVVYACGPPAMLESVRAIAEERDVPAQLALEAGMACGYGACFGCAIPTRDGYVRLCVDGPVLEAAALETALIPGTGH